MNIKKSEKSPESQRNALLEYTSHIRYSHKDLKPRGLACQDDKFREHEILVDSMIKAVEDETTPLSPVALPVIFLFFLSFF